MQKGKSEGKTTGRKCRFFSWKQKAILMILLDFIVIHFSYYFALWVRFDCKHSAIEPHYLVWYARTITVYALLYVAGFYLMRLYRSIWRFTSYGEISRIFAVSVGMSVLYTAVTMAISYRMPISYYLWGGIISFVLLSGMRFVYQISTFVRKHLEKTEEPAGRVMLIGGGSAGRLLIADLKRTRQICEKVVCIIDDDPNKKGRLIGGVPVVGGRDDILVSVDKYKVTKIVFAIPSASLTDRRDILSICSEADCELKQLPGMYQFVTGQVTANDIKDVSVEDLLGRAPIKTEMEEVFEFINGKTVLVTGGGGSIGSELCRQIAAHTPKRLVIFDVYENNAYSIQLELKEKYPDLDLVVLIGSVRDSRRIFQVFEDYRPQVVYHAAAHKHVPLMEDSPNESIKNNVIGTYKTAYAAMIHGCESFVLISTDKAVNPTNIMGASKRLCEMVVQSFDRKIKDGRAYEIPQLFTHFAKEDSPEEKRKTEWDSIKTKFVAVRFGNVLGSNGSVVPIFKEQIAKGGPVTVTHPDIIRYFMTIKEAVSLVMLAGVYAEGGEIFVLDMGSPVKIDTLARNLIKRSGYKPDVDIKIVYTGLRPGEKLYEEKLMAEEGLKKTDNDLIHIGCPIPFDTDPFFEKLAVLMDASYHNSQDINELVKDTVSTYHPAQNT